jgi:hypothetical protein
MFCTDEAHFNRINGYAYRGNSNSYVMQKHKNNIGNIIIISFGGSVFSTDPKTSQIKLWEPERRIAAC